MKKFWIVVLIIVLIGMLVFFSEILKYSIKNRGSWGEMFQSVEKIAENIISEEKMKIESTKKINLNFIASDIKIILTEEPELRVVEYSNNNGENSKLKISQSENEITLKEEQRRYFFVFNFGKSNSYDIYLPRQYENMLEITNTSGEVKIEENLKFSQLVIKTTSSDLKLPISIKADTVEIASVSGNVKIGEIESKELEIKTTSGRIEIGKVENKVQVESVSGEIEIEKIEGSFTANTTSGEIKMNSVKLTGDSNARSVSGSIKMNFVQDNQCLIRTKTTSGTVTLPNDRNTIGNEPYYNLDIKTTSGGIKLAPVL